MLGLWVWIIVLTYLGLFILPWWFFVGVIIIAVIKFYHDNGNGRNNKTLV